MSKPTVIAHISDLHCGSRYHIPSLAKRVVDELNELKPDIVVVTGDLTDMGFRQEFTQAHRLIEAIDCDHVAVLLGNHDARNVGDEHFADLFGERGVNLAYGGLRVLGLDSSEPDLDSGRIGRDRYRWIEERFSEGFEEFKVVAMHHHLVPVPGTGRERNIVHDAGDLLKVLATNGVDLVLCGHKHVPNVWRLEDMLIVNAGTCCTHRLRGKVRPCYNILEVAGTEVRVLLKEPYVDATIVADFHDVNRRYCRWRPGMEPAVEHGIEPVEGAV
ncbi:MAG TPA: metallophosphoesterase [Coriobacteriia bacterium]|nr:metallophosphoesterase [Coriobacteriia bacterium]